MIYGTIQTTVVSRNDPSFEPYYTYEVITTWEKRNDATFWKTEVARIDRDGSRHDVRDSDIFDFQRWGPLGGEVKSLSGHREALEAHGKVLLLVMG